ncbi:hypothetical protein C8J57DRAFT_1531871 [Mycena rebaudengoi]|nr:hypothetical protein C8J57DRAFT_1531871 [Mycena rebaudengoi]
MAMFSLGPLIGPVVGPITGGFVAETIGIKYVFIIVASLGGISSVVGMPVLSTYGIYYLMFTTFSDLFSVTYGFNTGTVGLTYLGLGFGIILAAVVGVHKVYIHVTLLAMKFSSNSYVDFLAGNKARQKRARNADSWINFWGAFCSCWVVLVWFVGRREAPLNNANYWISAGIFGFGMGCTFLSVQLYLVDTFTFAASAVSTVSVFRSLFGFTFPLFGQQLIDALGMGGGNSLLGGL